jgi:hypothetical protein
VIAFGMLILILKPEFDFLSIFEDGTRAASTAPAATVTQVAQEPTFTASPLPSTTRVASATPLIVVPTTAIPSATNTSTPIPPTLTATATSTLVPLTATPIPSTTPSPTLPPSATSTLTPSLTPAYYQRRIIFLENSIPFDMVSLPSTSPCMPINASAPEECIGKTLWIDLAPISADQYQLCVLRRICPSNPNDVSSGSAIGLSWLNAATFCEWRHGRLPTDSEITAFSTYPNEVKFMASFPEWLGVDKQGMLIAPKANLKRAAIWDGTLPFQLAQLEDEAIETNRDFVFRCVIYQA